MARGEENSNSQEKSQGVTQDYAAHVESEDEQTRYAATWKPVSVRPLAIAILAILQLVPFIVLEILLQKHKSAPFQFKTDDSSSYASWQYPAMAFFLVDGLLWEVVYARTCQLEPFYQLSRPEGARLESSLAMGYINTMTFLVPVKSAMAHHWTVFLASVVYFATFTLAPLLTRLAWTMVWPAYSRDTTVVVLMHESWCRVLEVLCLLSFVCGLGLAIIQRRRSGLLFEISSIEDLTRLLCDSPQFLSMLKKIPSHADSGALQEALQHCRFRLSYKQHRRLELVASEDPNTASIPRTIGIGNTSFDAHPFILFPPVVWAVQLMVSGVYLPIVLLATFPPDDFEPDILRPLFTALLLINTISWSGIQSSLSAILPFASLTARRQSKEPRVRSHDSLKQIRQRYAPGSTLLQVTAGSSLCLMALGGSLNLQLMMLLVNPLWDSTLAIVKKQGIYAPVPGCLRGPALLAQILSYIAPFISLAAFLNALLYRRVFAPRRPNTLVSKMVYLCRGEHLLHDVRDSKALGLATSEGCYSFGWFQDREGHWFVGVDRRINVAKEYKKVGETGPDVDVVQGTYRQEI
ncbi:hypothetical protein QC764_300410 [Podospora pseudoanserina]|uniref:Uncharacterized protein n=1 Tax=Podospora pseudoanserina TaxID=2609844 RepID=A0ABR0IBK1_9PEZI|nr:hypothetical protein QC764_300410 [Podospora pseudoanserina]